MEVLAKELKQDISKICMEYYYYKQTNVIEKGIQLSGKIQEFASALLQEDIFGIGEEEYAGLQNYVIQVLKDYMEAVAQRDVVLMIDVLDYGLRELLNIFIETDAAEETDE